MSTILVSRPQHLCWLAITFSPLSPNGYCVHSCVYYSSVIVWTLYAAAPLLPDRNVDQDIKGYLSARRNKTIGDANYLDPYFA